MSKQFRENLEIISSASGQSGLKLVNLPAGTAQTTYNGLLGLDASGNVIKINAATIATVTVSATAPSAPVTGQQWLDTSVSPSELKVYNGTSWELAGDEVQHYANFAAFPVTGDEDVLYVDDAADIIYVWDSTTSAYVNASGTGGGLFTITDGTNSQSIGVGNTLSILDTNLIKAEVSATDTLTVGIDTTGATTWQVPSYNGTNVVWTTPLSQNIYTDDGTLDSDRIVSMNSNYLRLADTTAPTKYVQFDTDVLPTVTFNTLADSANISFDEANSEFNVNYTAGTVAINSTDIQLNATSDVLIDSWNWSYSLVTSPATAPVLTWMEVLMRESTTGVLYKKDINTFDNIYTADGIITDPLRTISLDDANNTVRFDLDSSNATLIEAYDSYNPIEILYPWWNNASIEIRTSDPAADYAKISHNSWDVSPSTWLRLECLWWSAAYNWITLNSEFGNYYIETTPPSATTETQALVRGADWKLFLKNLSTLSTARYTNTRTPTANVETVHTHALAAGEDIQIQVRDSVTKEILDVEIRIISATTFGVTSTTTDPLKVVAL